MKKLVLAAALCAATAAVQAAPIQYNFAYDTGIGLLSGSLMGELQTDNNTIVISSLLDYVKFNGVAGPSLPTVTSLYYVVTNIQTGFGAVTTLDGSVQDINANYFGLLAGLWTLDFYTAGTLHGSTEAEAYVAANWSIEPAAAVPEPASLVLTGLGLVGLAISRRKA